MRRRKFTLAEYRQYKALPDWQRDDATFESPDQYEKHWVETIKSWRGQSKGAFNTTKEVWKLCTELFSKTKKPSPSGTRNDQLIAAAQIPVFQNAAYDKVAMLWSNFPRPVYTPIQESENSMIALANMLKDVELKVNSFNTMGFDLGLDQYFTDLALLKMYTVNEEGIFGQDQKIVIEQADPFCFWPDPKATRLKWDKMKFLIYENEMTLGEVHSLFPGSQGVVKEGVRTDTPDADGTYGDNLKTVIPQNEAQGSLRSRDMVRITECWFKDYREDFEADWDEEEYEEGGQTCVRPCIKVDDKGYVVGTWERAYPDGRCIILADDMHVISDYGNPYWHKKAPFIMIPARPGSRRQLLRPGEAVDVLRLHYKINDCEERTHRMAQNEIERPMLAETGTFPTPRSWYKTSKMAEAILVKNPGREFARMPPTETPQFAEAYLARLNTYVDRTTGISGVMRGQLAEGSQISAEAMSSLQGMGSTRLMMQSELIAEGMIEAGDMLFWLIRETYPSGIQCVVTMADGTSIPVIWNEDDLKTAYLVEIDSMSGLPGGKQAGANQAVTFFDKKLVDRQYALQANKVAGWQGIVQRMDQTKLAEIKASAEGRAIGVEVKKFEKADNEPGRTERPVAPMA